MSEKSKPNQNKYAYKLPILLNFIKKILDIKDNRKKINTLKF